MDSTPTAKSNLKRAPRATVNPASTFYTQHDGTPVSEMEVDPDVGLADPPDRNVKFSHRPRASAAASAHSSFFDDSDDDVEMEDIVDDDGKHRCTSQNQAHPVSILRRGSRYSSGPTPISHNRSRSTRSRTKRFRFPKAGRRFPPSKLGVKSCPRCRSIECQCGPVDMDDVYFVSDSEDYPYDPATHPPPHQAPAGYYDDDYDFYGFHNNNNTAVDFYPPDFHPHLFPPHNTDTDWGTHWPNVDPFHGSIPPRSHRPKPRGLKPRQLFDHTRYVKTERGLKPVPCDKYGVPLDAKYAAYVAGGTPPSNPVPQERLRSPSCPVFHYQSSSARAHSQGPSRPSRCGSANPLSLPSPGHLL